MLSLKEKSPEPGGSFLGSDCPTESKVSLRYQMKGSNWQLALGLELKGGVWAQNHI